MFINVLINLNNQKFALWSLELINLINLIYKIKLVVPDWKALSVLLFTKYAMLYIYRKYWMDLIYQNEYLAMYFVA